MTEVQLSTLAENETLLLILKGQRFVGESNKARSDAGLERKGTLSANPQRGGLEIFFLDLDQMDKFSI